jgi:predicted AAA+ superfamily ATPase
MPLIVRGARQVGKTYAIQSFAKEAFPSVMAINFEAAPNYTSCFATMDPTAIIRSIELISRQTIVPGETLLFLDEIQQCPRALQSLRYFKENLPELHIIAAGSLLEFAMEDESFSFPVGRVQFARLYPLSFLEFLDAIGDGALREELASCRMEQPPSQAIHQQLLLRLSEYFIVGGMPNAVLAYLKTQSFLEVQYVQKAIWDTYENDFAKYAPKTHHRHMKKIFQEVPRLIGNHVKYSKIDPELPNPAREMKRALELLQLAGLMHPIIATSAGGVPLTSGMRETIFKMIFLDIGLVEQGMGLEPQNPGLMTGPLAEQFVGQELIANGDAQLETRLFFWAPEAGSAEVDYLLTRKGNIIPVEVKAGKWGKLKSLQRFMHEKKTRLGIKISSEPLNRQEHILSVPLYLTAHLFRLIEQEERQP